MKQDSIFSPNAATVRSAEIRLEKQDWQRIGSDLNSFGCSVIDKLLTRDECGKIAALYPEEGFFRSHVHMARHGSVRANTGTSSIRCRICSEACGLRSIRAWRSWPTIGTGK